MSKETVTAIPTDRSRIDIKEPLHVRYWCGELRCTEGQLLDAVKRVGTTVARVQAYLR
jgi:hypothetical protein